MSAASRLAHYRRLESQLAAARKALVDKQCEIDTFLISVAGVSVGDIVTMKDGKTARVVRILPEWVKPRGDTFGKPCVEVNFMRVDGSWSRAVRSTFMWEHADPAARTAEVPA